MEDGGIYEPPPMPSQKAARRRNQYPPGKYLKKLVTKMTQKSSKKKESDMMPMTNTLPRRSENCQRWYEVNRPGSEGFGNVQSLAMQQLPSQGHRP